MTKLLLASLLALAACGSAPVPPTPAHPPVAAQPAQPQPVPSDTLVATGTWEDAGEMSELLAQFGIEAITVGSLGASLHVPLDRVIQARDVLGKSKFAANVLTEADLEASRKASALPPPPPRTGP